MSRQMHRTVQILGVEVVRKSVNADEPIVLNMALEVADRRRTLELLGEYAIHR